MALTNNTAPLSNKGKVMTERYVEMMGWVEVDTRTGDEIAADIINRAGLKVKE